MEALGVRPHLVRTCHTLRIVEPTDIQRATIPHLLQRRNLLGVAETGSGKTACYSLPILQLLSDECYGVYALVLLPTKELALQVYEQFCAFSAPFGWDQQITWVVGGDNWISQSQALSRRPYVVVATPGRLLQHLEQDDIRLGFSNLAVLVLDEADRLLSGTMKEDIDQVLEYLPSADQRQTILFTATSTPDVMDYVRHLDAMPANSSQHGLHSERSATVIVNTVKELETVLPNLEHYYMFIPAQVKLVYLLHLLLTDLNGQSGVIFARTCRTAQVVTTCLELFDLSVTCLHGLLDHRRRRAHLAKFRSNAATLLVATDVASRGLDIPKVNFVINYDFPTRLEGYVHRAGRTARAGRKGVTLSLICEKDNTTLVKAIEQHIHQEVELFQLNEQDVLKRLSEVSRKQQEANQILLEAGFFDRAADARKAKLKKKFGTTKVKKIKPANPSL